MVEFFKKIRNFLIPLSLCAIILVLMKTVLFLGYIPTASMEPTISAGSYVLGLRLHGTLVKGDVIIFHHGDRVLLKRISATASDTVTRPNDTSLAVPEGCYYVLGDNIEESIDSRYWDEPFVEEKDVIALVLLFC